ncbi:hypothetical protein JCM24511_00123 [Saitozyma sp. JCM 24511]|nr:hypothetical protein JCM24511_00123 [Saitozyma sp. JCM 24511]
MPRKPREVKSTAPSPSPARELRGSSRSRTATADLDPDGKFAAAAEVARTRSEDSEMIQESDTDGIAQEVDEADEADEDGVDGQEGGETEDAETEMETETEVQDGTAEDDDAPAAEGSAEGLDKGKGKMTMEERMAKLKDLRVRMSQSTAANRKDLVADHQKSKVTAKELQRLEKQRKLAQTLRLKAEAEDSGEDLERRKAWEWSIEQNERWEAKMEDQRVRSDSRFHNAEDEAFKKYNRDIRNTKADLVAYERQKEAALGLAPGTLVPAGATSASLATSSRSKGLTASEDLYRGAHTLAYGDSKPSEEAVDRVIGKINKDMGKGKRKKNDDEDAEVNYINDRNKKFNQKAARFYDKFTRTIRENFERGTAL